MSALTRWLNWTPDQSRKIEESQKMGPTKPTKPDFEGFEGTFSGENPIIRRTENNPAPEPTQHVKRGGACPYSLPDGVKMVRFTRKAPPVPVTVCSIVIDIDKFIRHALAELEARLHHPVQIKAGDSAFELLSKLADCGLELRIDWLPEGRIISDSPEAEPSKPTKLREDHQADAHGLDISDEDLPI